MGLFGRMKDGIKSRANSALDKAIDPEKELDMAILELEEGRKRALQELISYKATAKQMEQEIEKFTERAAGWEKKAMIAVRAGDDDAARLALKEKKLALVEVEKIKRDRDEAASYAIQLNKSRKDFDVKLQILKMRRGTLATQLAAARSGGNDTFAGTSELFDKFERAEQRIDDEAIETEVDAALRGEELASAEFDAKLLAAGGDPNGTGADPDAALAAIKAKVAGQRAERQARLDAADARVLAPGAPGPDTDDGGPKDGG